MEQVRRGKPIAQKEREPQPAPPEAAVKSVAAGGGSEVGTMGGYRVVGHPVIRKDALEKVTGSAVFGPDIALPGQLYGAVYRSPHAHAKILSVDVTAARAAPGVRVVLTEGDIPGLFGQFIVDQPVLARDKVVYHGQPVVAVAADTQAAALEAVGLVRAEYEKLDPVRDPVKAMEPGSPLVHDRWSDYACSSEANPRDGTNLCDHFRLRCGDVEQGFREADVVVENEYRTAGVNHSAIEVHCATAKVDPATGQLTIWSPAQSPYLIRKQLAALFGLRHKDVRLICTLIGGGFGGKYELKAEPIAAALALHAAGRPVRLVFGRGEDYLGGCVRGPAVVRIKTGARRDGRLVAQKIETYFDTGAYSTTGPRINYNAGLAAISPYKIPNVSVDGYTVATNKQITSAYRGFGKPEICFAYENQMDILAEKLELDPLEIRLKNVYHTGDVSATGETLEAVGVEQCLQEAARLIRWDRGWQRRVTPEGKLRAKGIACGCKLTGTPSTSSVLIKFHDDASVTVLQSGMELGQGVTTVIPQMVAEALGLPLENVDVAPVDTMYTPYEKTTTGSRLTFHVGNAALRACDDVIEQLRGLAAIAWKADKEEIRYRDGHLYGPGGRDLPLTEIGASSLMREQEPVLGRGLYTTSDVFVKPDPETHHSEKPTVQWFWVAQAVELEVDPKTGKTTILDFAAAQDVGQAISTMNCVQQVEGGVVMGMGHALLEELIYDGDALLKNGNMVDFKVPTAKDTQFDIKVSLVENPTPDGPFGARGIGEPPIVPVAAAIGCAVSRATGVRMKSIPLKADNVQKAVKEAAGEEEVPC